MRGVPAVFSEEKSYPVNLKKVKKKCKKNSQNLHFGVYL
jgi:hypothetical protein